MMTLTMIFWDASTPVNKVEISFRPLAMKYVSLPMQSDSMTTIGEGGGGTGGGSPVGDAAS
jgi:hypothetical protein